MKRLVKFASLEALTRAMSWGMMMLLPFLTTVERYGEISLFIAFLGIGATVISVGLDRAILRFYKSWDKDRGILLEVFLLGLFFFLLFLSLGFLLFFFFEFEFAEYSTIYLITILICAYLKSLLTFGVAVSRVERSNLLLFYFRFAPQLVQFIAIGFAVLFFSSSVAFVLAIAGTLLLFALYEAFIFAKRGLFLRDSGMSISSVRRTLTLCWPFLFLSAAGYIHAQIDRVLIAHLSEMRDVGLYSLSYTFGSSINLVFALVMFVSEANVYKAQGSDEAAERIHLMGAFQLSVGLSVGALFCVLGQPLIAYLYPSEYSESYGVMSIIFAAHVIHPIYLMGSMALMYSQRTFWLIFGILPSAALNILLNFYYIPIFGIWGAAVATLASYVLLGFVIYGLFIFQFWKVTSLRRHLLFVGGGLVAVPSVVLLATPLMQFFVFSCLSLLLVWEYRESLPRILSRNAT